MSRRPTFSVNVVFLQAEVAMESNATLEVTYLPTTSIKPHPHNPRVHSDKQVHQIARSIEAFGFNVPILVDERQNVVAGHGRLLASGTIPRPTPSPDRALRETCLRYTPHQNQFPLSLT